MDVRRGLTASLTAGLLLLGAPAWAQEDPCAPDANGDVPVMCQSGPVSDTGTVGVEPDPAVPDEGPCPAQPVEEGDAPQVAPGEPPPGTDPEQPVADEPVADEPVADEPVSEEPVEELVAEEPVSEEPVQDDAPLTDPSVICQFAVPVAGADDTGAGGEEAGPVVDGRQLPLTGDRVLALTVLGAGLLVAGAGAAAAGRRRTAC